MRLDSIREVLRPISNENSSVLMERRNLQQQLQNPTVPRIVNDTAIVVAFRDSYLHAEIAASKRLSKKPPALAEFRQTLNARYSLFHVCMACLRVWMELYKLCMRSIRA